MINNSANHLHHRAKKKMVRHVGSEILTHLHHQLLPPSQFISSMLVNADDKCRSLFFVYLYPVNYAILLAMQLIYTLQIAMEPHSDTMHSLYGHH